MIFTFPRPLPPPPGGGGGAGPPGLRSVFDCDTVLTGGTGTAAADEDRLVSSLEDLHREKDVDIFAKSLFSRGNSISDLFSKLNSDEGLPIGTKPPVPKGREV